MNYLLFGLLLVSALASADSVIDCNLSAGPKDAVAYAPNHFTVDEEGAVTLLVDGKSRATIDVSGKGTFFDGSADILFKLAVDRKMKEKGKIIQSFEVYEVKGCSQYDQETTTASFSLKYKQGSKDRVLGPVNYSCVCKLA